VEYAVPLSIVDEIAPGGLPPGDFDPLADGILMVHQKAWVEDEADIKIGDKGRRTGMTWAEALSDVLIAASAKSAGGDNIWYIGDTKDKGREFIDTSARFAEKVAKELLAVEDFLFEDKQDDGTSKFITAWRITFASGFKISALSSNPANIRGLQGIVVIDEAAFHANVGKVLEACLALLIWGGKIRIISTHNGKTNAFNQLLKEALEGKIDASVHHVPFDTAVANGLYERVCYVRGKPATHEGKAEWYAKIRKAYGSRHEAMREELDAIPREGDGTMIPLVWIEACQTQTYKVARWEPPDTGGGREFVDWPEATRREVMATWLKANVDPILGEFPEDAAGAIGGDFAMRQDRSDYAVGYVDRLLWRRVPLVIELRTCPYDQQKQALFHVGRWLRTHRRLKKGVLDANGNGMVLAQEARQEFGPETIVELMPSDAWLRETTPKFRAAFEEKTILIPANIDVRDDVHQFRVINGVGKIPSDVRTVGTDGGKRHADSGVALLNFYAATLTDVHEYGYTAAASAAPAAEGRMSLRSRDDDDRRGGFDARSGLGGTRGGW